MALPTPSTRPGQDLAHDAPQMLVRKMDVTNPPGEGIASYLFPLSLQTQVVPVHHEDPWGLHALSGPQVPPCQALLKIEMAI